MLNINLQFFGGRGSSSGMAGGNNASGPVDYSAIHGTNANGYIQVDNNGSVSKATIMQAADMAIMTMTEPDTYRIGVNVGGDAPETATNLNMASSVRIQGPQSVYTTSANQEAGKYEVHGDYYHETFDSLSAAQSVARKQLKTQLSKTYDLRMKNRQNSYEYVD